MEVFLVHLTGELENSQNSTHNGVSIGCCANFVVYSKEYILGSENTVNCKGWVPAPFLARCLYPLQREFCPSLSLPPLPCDTVALEELSDGLFLKVIYKF